MITKSAKLMGANLITGESHKIMEKKQDLTMILKNKRTKLSSNTMSSMSSNSSSTSSSSYSNSSPGASNASVRKDLKNERADSMISDSHSFNYFHNQMSNNNSVSNISMESFYNNVNSNPNFAQSQLQDPNHIYYQNSNLIQSNGQNYGEFPSNYNQHIQLQQQQSLNLQQQSQNFPAQQQYYYYPTPESSPDVPFQLLNDATVLSAATQHLIASNSQNTFLINNNNNFNSKRNINTDLTNSTSSALHSSSSDASSTSPSPSEVNANYSTGVSFNYNQLPVSAQNPRENQNMLSPNSTGNSSFSPYQFNNYQNGNIINQNMPTNDDGSKISQNWYLSAAAAAVAASASHLPTNPLIYSSELSNKSLNTNSFHNFQHKF